MHVKSGPLPPLPPPPKCASQDNGGKLLAIVRLDILSMCVWCVLQLFYFGEIISMDYDRDSKNFLIAGKLFHLDIANCSMRPHSVCTTFLFLRNKSGFQCKKTLKLSDCCISRNFTVFTR